MENYLSGESGCEFKVDKYSAWVTVTRERLMEIMEECVKKYGMKEPVGLMYINVRRKGVLRGYVRASDRIIRISCNSLAVYLHELAHVIDSDLNGYNVKPHGKSFYKILDELRYSYLDKVQLTLYM